jgi:hypothetical protein
VDEVLDDDRRHACAVHGSDHSRGSTLCLLM